MIIAPNGAHGKSLKEENNWIKEMDQYDFVSYHLYADNDKDTGSFARIF